MFLSGKSDDKFFTVLTEAAETIVEATQMFEQLSREMERNVEYADRLKTLEKKGDRHTHDVISMLNKMFVTPLDREDILALAVKLDDVLDSVEACASRFPIYGIAEYDHYINSFAKILCSQAEEIQEAIRLLAGKQLLRMRENAVKINLLENQADQVLRESLKHLFSNEKDPIHLIKMKEVYETLEMATDRAEDVANTLESVIMKNA